MHSTIEGSEAVARTIKVCEKRVVKSEKGYSCARAGMDRSMPKRYSNRRNPMKSTRSFYALAESSPTARRLLWHVYSMSTWTHIEPITIPPFTKPGASMLWVTGGEGKLKLGDLLLDLKKGSFWAYSTSRARTIAPAPGQWLTIEGFLFNGPGLESWLEELNLKDNPQLEPARPKMLQKAFHNLRGLIRRRPPRWELKVHRQLDLILQDLLVSGGKLAPSQPEMAPAITAALNAIDADPERNWNTAQLARSVGMSDAAFRALFRKNMNESPHAYILRVRLDLARHLLSDPKMRIKEIAARLHFSSKYYFSSFFHEHAGISPTQFRKTNRHTPPIQ